jgi:hypothetical protein
MVSGDTTANRQLTLHAQGAENGGDIDFGVVGQAIGQQFLGAFRALTNGNGVLTLNDNISVQNQLPFIPADVAGVTVEANVLPINGNITVSGPGNIVANALKPNDLEALTIGPGKLLTTDGGRISQSTLTLNAAKDRFIALDKSVLLVPPLGQELTPSQRTATIGALVDDALGQDYELTLDWIGENVIVNDPVTDLRFIITDPTNPPPLNFPFIDGALQSQFSHVYDANPSNNPADDIDMTVNITRLATGTIQIMIGGRPLVADIDQSLGSSTIGRYTQNAIGITTTLTIPVLDLPAITTALPEPITRVTPQPPPPVVEANVEIAQPVVASVNPLAGSTAGTTSTAEERYYILRIVSFDSEGNPIEVDSIRLDTKQEIGIYPFDLSKLHELFGRLPADRYRLYLFEDGTERLILDFTIQQGQPIETSDIEESGNQGDDPGTPFNDDHPAEPSINVNPAENNELQGSPAGLPVDDRAAGLVFPADPVLARSRVADSFAERLGNTSFLSHGGLVIGTAALAYTTSDRWEKSIDRLMERFDRRRRRAGSNATATGKRRAPEVSSHTSPKRPK